MKTAFWMLGPVLCLSSVHFFGQHKIEGVNFFGCVDVNDSNNGI